MFKRERGNKAEEESDQEKREGKHLEREGGRKREEGRGERGREMVCVCGCV